MEVAKIFVLQGDANPELPKMMLSNRVLQAESLIYFYLVNSVTVCTDELFKNGRMISLPISRSQHSYCDFQELHVEYKPKIDVQIPLSE